MCVRWGMARRTGACGRKNHRAAGAGGVCAGRYRWQRTKAKAQAKAYSGRRSRSRRRMRRVWRLCESASKRRTAASKASFVSSGSQPVRRRRRRHTRDLLMSRQGFSQVKPFFCRLFFSRHWRGQECGEGRGVMGGAPGPGPGEGGEQLGDCLEAGAAGRALRHAAGRGV